MSFSLPMWYTPFPVKGSTSHKFICPIFGYIVFYIEIYNSSKILALIGLTSYVKVMIPEFKKSDSY